MSIRTRRSTVAMFMVLGGFVAALGIALMLAGPANVDDRLVALQTADPVDLTVSSPGETAPGTPLDLSSFSSAVASLSSGDVRLDWPGGDDLGATAITGASVATNTDERTIVFQGSATIDGNTLDAIVILDWDEGTTPTVSLGIDGSLDVATLNPNWDLEGEAFVIDGYFAIATGTQDLSVIPAATAFYEDREELPAGLEVEGEIALSSILPGLGEDAEVTATLGASLEADIAAVLTSAPLVPGDTQSASFTATVEADELDLPSLDGLTAGNLEITIDLIGEEGDTRSGVPDSQTFNVSASAEVTIDNPRISASPVVFDIDFTKSGTDVSASGGLKVGTTWNEPFGAANVTISAFRIALESGELSIDTDVSIGGVGFTASIVAGPDLSVRLAVDEVTVGDVMTAMNALGLNVGDPDALDDEVSGLTISNTSLILETDGADITGSFASTITFRGKSASILVAGGTAADAGLLLAIDVDSFTVGDLWSGAPSPLDATPLPAGSVIITNSTITEESFEAGGVADTYLARQYCDSGPSAPPCEYEIRAGVTLAGSIPLDEGLKTALLEILPISDEPVRISGFLPVFEPGPFELDIALPAIRPEATSNSAKWLQEARLGVSFRVEGGDFAVKLTGAIDVLIPDEELGAIVRDAGTPAEQRFDLVTFSVDAEISLGTSGVSLTIGANVGGWDTPLGIDWISLNGFRLEVKIIVAPDPSVQLGLAASAQLNGKTYAASFAIKVGVGTPVKVEAGMRVFAESLSINDVARIAEKIADQPENSIDTSALPTIALKNVELSVSTIDAPSLCLQRGVIIAANIHLDDTTPSNPDGSTADSTGELCNDTSISPAEGIADCAANPDCFAHARFSLTEDGISAAASIGQVDLGGLTIDGASLAIVLDEQEQSFDLNGMVTVKGFATVAGSVSIQNSTENCSEPDSAILPCPGFAFSVSTQEVNSSGDPVSGGNEFSVSGATTLDVLGGGSTFKVNVFVRLPDLDAALQGAQEIVRNIREALDSEFDGGTEYSIRCVEVDIDVASNTSDPISGTIGAKVHFSAIDQATGFEDAKIWRLTWDFDGSIQDNLSAVLAAFSQEPDDDAEGCGVAPLAQTFTVNGQTNAPDITVVNQDTDAPVVVQWSSQDFSTYAVSLDLGDGSPLITLPAQRYAKFDSIRITGTARYPESEAGYERRNIVAKVYNESFDGAVIGEINIPLLLNNGKVTNYSISDFPATVSPGSTLNLGASWVNPVFESSLTSRWTYTIIGNTATTTTQNQTGLTSGSSETFPIGSEFSDTVSIPIPDPCACAIVVSHALLSNGLFPIETTNKRVLVDFNRPEITVIAASFGTGPTIPLGPSDDIFVQISDSPISGDYDVFLYGKRATGVTRAGSVLVVPSSNLLDEPGIDSGDLVRVPFEVRRTTDGPLGMSEIFRKNIQVRPSNDSPSTPEFLFFNIGAEVSKSATSTTAFATTSDDTPNPFGSADCGAVWFQFTAPQDAEFELSTVGSRTRDLNADGGFRQGVAIAVYDFADNFIGSVEPGAVGSEPTVVKIAVTADTTYKVALAASAANPGCDDDPTTSGPVTLTVTPLAVPPFNDSILGAFEQLPGTDDFALVEKFLGAINPDFTVTLDNASLSPSGSNDPLTSLELIATDAAGFSDCFDDPLEQTVWYLVNSSSTPSPTTANVEPGLPVDFTLGQTTGDIQIAVFDVDDLGDPSTFATELIGCAESNSLIDDIEEPAQPFVRFTPEDGHSYVMMIDTHGRQDATTIPFIVGAGSTEATPIPLTTGAPESEHPNALATDIIIDVDTLACSSKTFDHNLLFTWTADSGAPVDITAFGADLALAVVPVDDFIDVDEPEAPCSDQPGDRGEFIRLDPTIGEQYYIFVGFETDDGFGGFNTDRSTFVQVTVRGDVERLFRRDFPVRETLSNVGATSDGRTPDCSTVASDPDLGLDTTSITVGFDVPADLDVDIDTIGSDFDTRLALSNVGQTIRCNDDLDTSGGRDSRITEFLPKIGTGSGAFSDYYLTIDGFGSAQGTIDLDITTKGDDLHNAVAVSGTGAVGSLSNTYATVEANERRGDCHFQGDALNASVWWEWTATEDGIFDVAANGFDTQLTVFAGEADAAGEIVGCGEDEAGVAAETQVAAVAGQSVYLQVDGYQGNTGMVALSVALAGPYDVDGDGFHALIDNCPTDSNADQANNDGDTNGDACDPDDDNDTVLDVDDNCRVDANPGQTDSDGDGIGDACDPDSGDSDGDDVDNADDNCPDTPNPDQFDGDGDGDGDLCDTSEYTSLSPVRLVDTREGEDTIDGLFAGDGMIGAQDTYEVQIAGRGGVSPTATSAVLNFTTIAPQGFGFLTVYDCGDFPLASAANYAPGELVNNEIIAKLSSTGSLCIYSEAPTDIAVDVAAYTTPIASYQSLNPARLVDTRPGEETDDGLFLGDGAIQADSFYEVQIGGRGGVPADASSAVFNLTTVGPGGAGFITVYPCGDIPKASSANYGPGQIVNNEIIAKLSSTGTVCFYSLATTDLIVDVVGAIPATANYIALTPARLADTRPGEETTDGLFLGDGAIQADTFYEIGVAGRGGVPADASTAVINLTTIAPQGPGFITVYPCGDIPKASSANYGPGQLVNNEIIAKLSPTGTICVYSLAITDLVVDVVGAG